MRSHCLQPEEYDASEKMRLAAAELGNRDRKLLMEIWQTLGLPVADAHTLNYSAISDKAEGGMAPTRLI